MATDLLGELRKKLQRLSAAAEISEFNKQERMEYEDTLKAYRDWFSVMKTAEIKGEAKGRAEGRAEEKYEIARNLKNCGVDTATIISATGLSAEEIAGL